MESTDDTELLTILVNRDQLALLKKHYFPGSEGLIASAKTTRHGIELSGSWNEFDNLAGWVAAEANDARRTRRPRQTELFDDMADQLEVALL